MIVTTTERCRATLVPPKVYGKSRFSLYPSTSQALKLAAVHSSSTCTYGYRQVDRSLGLRRTYLLVDLQRRSIIDPATNLTSSGTISICPSDILSIIFEDAPDLHVCALLRKYCNIATKCSLSEPVKHDVQHHINNTGSPIFSKVRPLPPQQLTFARKNFEELLKQGVCRRSDSC